MKIGILSDIHVDINLAAGSPVVQDLEATMVDSGINKMIIAGDVASDYEVTLFQLAGVRKRHGCGVPICSRQSRYLE